MRGVRASLLMLAGCVGLIVASTVPAMAMGQIVRYPVPESYPNFLINGPDGNMWFTNEAGGNVHQGLTKMDHDGRVLAHYSSQDSVEVYSPVVAGDGAIWSIESGQN